MRATVDEKLHATLEQRLGESFKQVADRLEQVHKGLGEMQTLARDVGCAAARADQREDARRVRRGAARRRCSSRCSRPSSTPTNVETVPGSGERVEFAIRLPGPARRRRAAVAADRRQVPARRLRAAARRRTSAPTRRRAEAGRPRRSRRASAPRRRTIREKYVVAAAHHRLRDPVPADRGPLCRGAAPPRPGGGACSASTASCSAGPTTLLAMLNSLQMGFRTLALEQQLVGGLGGAGRGQDRVRQVRRRARQRRRRSSQEAQQDDRRRRGAHARDDAQAAQRRGAARAARAAAAARTARRRPTSRRRCPSAAPRPLRRRPVRLGRAGRADRRPARAALVHGRPAHGGAAARRCARATRMGGGVLLGLFAAAPIVLALRAGRLADRHGYHLPIRVAVGLTGRRRLALLATWCLGGQLRRCCASPPRSPAPAPTSA